MSRVLILDIDRCSGQLSWAPVRTEVAGMEP